MDMEQRTLDFAAFANSFGIGFIKRWKANSMLAQLDSQPELYEEPHLTNFVRGCLMMEGFSYQTCDDIIKYLNREKINETKTE
jgi:hypothetical protein